MKGFRIFTDSAGIPHQRGGLINRTGYLKGAKTNRNKVNIIPSSHITTKNMVAPVWANGMKLNPDTGDYHFNSPFVVEHRVKKRRGGRMYQQGGQEPTGPITFLNSYYNSPEFKARFLANNSQSDWQAQQNKYKTASSSYKPAIINGATSAATDSANNQQYGYPKGTTMVLDPRQASEIGADLFNGILPHEYTHSLSSLPNADQFRILALSKNANAMKNVLDLYRSDKGNPGLDFSRWMNTRLSSGSALHDEQPEEQHADLNTLRWLMYKNNIYDTRKGNMTQDDLNRALSDPGIRSDFNVNRLLNNFTPENLTKFNNTVAGNTQNTPTSRWGGRTKTSPQYLSIYPETQIPMRRKSLRGRMRVGGQHFDPQLGNYKSNIYAFGGLSGFGYPYYGYNDSERGMLSGMMQAGGPLPPGGSLHNAGYAGQPYNGDTNGRLIDNVNSLLVGTGRNLGSYGGDTARLNMQAYIYHQTHPGMSPEQSITGFFNRPVDEHDQTDVLRRSLSKLGYGPVGSYYDSPNITLRKQLWGGDVPDARNNRVTDGIKTGRVTTSKFKATPDEFGDYDWTTTPGGGYKKGGWLKGAVNPAHKGYCTPMSKPTCTGHRRAFALMMKKNHGFHQAGGPAMQQPGMPPPQMAVPGQMGNWQSGTPPQVPPQMRPPIRRTAQRSRGRGIRRHAVGGTIPGQYLQGFEMQMGGYPSSFTPAGSMIDQNQWAMSSDTTPMAPQTGNYYKSDPSQTDMSVYGNTNAVPLTRQQPKPTGSSFGTPNLNNLRMLLPANAFLSNMAQNNQWRQNDSWRRSSMNNPLATEGWSNGRTPESRYGYSNSLFQQGGINGAAKSREGYLSFAGRPMKLWQAGGNISTTGYRIPTPTLLRDQDGRVLNPSYQFLPKGSPQDSTDYRSGFYNTIKRERAGDLHPLQGPAFYYDQDFTPGSNRNDNNLYAAGHNTPYNQGVSEAYMNTKAYAYGGDTGAATVLRPYMLHQGRFQQGGDIQDQWDVEDAQDQADQSQQVQEQPEDDDTLYNTEYQRRADLSDDEDYNAALQIAMQSNPYWG